MFLLFLGAFIISFAPILVKATSIDPSWSAVGRLIIATALLGMLVPIRIITQKDSWKQTFKTAKPSLHLLFIAGLFFGIDLFFWHRSIHYVGAGIATVLGNTQVLFLTAWSTIETKQKPSLRFMTATLIALFGLFLLVDFNGNQLKENYALGVFLGLLTGMTYAIFLILLRKTGIKSPKIPTFDRLFIFSFAAMLFLVSIAFGTEQIPSVSARDLWLLFLLGGIVHIGGWTIIGKGLPKLSSAKAGLILLTQPVLATALGWLFFRETLTGLQLFGMAITLIGIYLGETAPKIKAA